MRRIQASPQWRNGRFRNPDPIRNDYVSAVSSVLASSPDAVPREPIPVRHPAPGELLGTGWKATWLGHSTVFLDLEGTRILTDPVWSHRTSPVPWAGPARFFAPPVPLTSLPDPDVVVISHDHFDHLDRRTIRRFRDREVRFVVPLGVGARLAAWGIPAPRITELDWWERCAVGGVEIVCTPARHASGRSLFDRDRTLWSGFAFLGKAHRIWFSGDTGFFPGLGAIGRRLGPFDLTLIECGAYNRAWPDWHLGPEQAVQAHGLAGGQALLPIHWGTFKLAAHGWTEPVERVLAEAARTGTTVLTPRPGEPVGPGQATDRWWPDLPWESADQAPVLTRINPLVSQPLRRHP
jgi:L-ascorbate metabolism protein UlaG (beta-lactamase superfamily)